MDPPDVTAALTFPAKCEMAGERFCTVVGVQLGSQLRESELKAHAAERLARFKVPKLILFLDEIPKGPTGKMQRIGMAHRLGLE